MSVGQDEECANRELRRRTLIQIAVIAAGLIVLAVLHSAIPRPAAMQPKTGNLIWVRGGASLALTLRELDDGRLHGWCGWWPVFRPEGTTEVATVRRGIFLQRYILANRRSRAFHSLPSQTGEWPRIE
jgi:hypothetical protein